MAQLSRIHDVLLRISRYSFTATHVHLCVAMLQRYVSLISKELSPGCNYRQGEIESAVATNRNLFIIFPWWLEQTTGIKFEVEDASSVPIRYACIVRDWRESCVAGWLLRLLLLGECLYFLFFPLRFISLPFLFSSLLLRFLILFRPFPVFIIAFKYTCSLSFTARKKSWEPYRDGGRKQTRY